MSEYPQIKVLKKRGRKPKNKIPDIIQEKEELIDSDKEVIIAYLPINLHEHEHDNKKLSNDIFIKQDIDSYDKNIKIKKKMDILNISSSESETKNSVNNNFNKINIYNIKINENTKCWWCKHSFTNPNLSLPEHYFDSTFYCIGNFCSWECMKSYNIDTGDNFIWKRESLINLMYYQTYGTFKEIKYAPSWLTLEDFGGNLSINNFRKNFEIININFLVLHPPLISRQLQIEESYKKIQNNVVVNKLDKSVYDQPINNLMLRRNKPIETSQINLEKSMGLKRK